VASGARGFAQGGTHQSTATATRGSDKRQRQKSSRARSASVSLICSRPPAADMPSTADAPMAVQNSLLPLPAGPCDPRVVASRGAVQSSCVFKRPGCENVMQLRTLYTHPRPAPRRPNQEHRRNQRCMKYL
jgi:hypothetical protein